MSLAVSACATPKPDVVAKSPAGITLRSDKVFSIGDAALKRDRAMSAVAEQHCRTVGKNFVLTLRDTKGNWVTTTFECR